MSMAAPPRQSQTTTMTAFASTASLSSLASTATVTPPISGQVVATSNIINQKADASRSLYQICVALKQRLAQVPSFEDHMQQLEQLETGEAGGDPVEALWQMFRSGYALLAIYNALQPEQPLTVDDEKGDDKKKSKIAIFKFIKACMSDLHIPPSECFVVGDVTRTDTTGFVKVTTVVNHVLDLAKERGLLLQVQPYPEDEGAVEPGGKLSYRDYVVRELVDTERKYVQDLENLHDLKKTLEQRGIINGDIVHQIFLNINAILDFQRRFLIRVETTNSVPQLQQRWGQTFVITEEAFVIYQPFIANQRKAAQIAQSLFEKIQSAEHPVAVDFNTLDGFLLKPMQRLVKYPLLLKDLLKKSEDDEERADLEAGIAAAERVLHNANKAVDRDLLDEALDDLMDRVDDWKSHRVEHFGKLLLHGVHTVVTGKSDQEKDYEIYLFENILLCCKEIAPNKSKEKRDRTKSTGPKLRNKSAKLQLKGRIFMSNVTEIVSLSKPGSYTVQIWWKGDPGVENFVVKFQTEEPMKKWAARLDAQRKVNAPRPDQSPEQAAPPDFAWMKTQDGGVNALQNPYAQEEEEEEEEEDLAQQLIPPQFNTSILRARSATSDGTQSIVGLMRQPPPRFPLPAPPTPLSLQTQMTSQQALASSPNFRGGESYFSPVAESPVSSRTSTTSGMFPPSAGYMFSKSGTPQPGGWEGDVNRYTAPAMPRASSRDGPSPSNAYGMVNGRNPRGPSMPAMPKEPQTLTQLQRSRSYSTPDINGQQARRTPGGSQGNIPAVPGIPQHLHATHERHDSTIPRSNTGSPRIDLPMRSSTQSPSVQQNRLQPQPGVSYGATMAQFPTQPIYPRQTTPGPSGASQQNGTNPQHVPTPLSLNEPVWAPASPPLGTGMSLGMMDSDMLAPTQLKVKVNYDSSNYMTLVVAFNITYQSLIDRIDAKLARFTDSSIGKGMLKLRYQDEDGDFVSIGSDDDIQIAFMEWCDGLKNQYNAGVSEIELFCV
ncbi:Rho guanyl nucleotide exchange factor [Grosmannia clavigera kw1407]|uniref:Rho guanyl nucleotide exchange factor n=1 Tax=Grosmannia clavigera (strain kw1407 / UAMH 11150) TaxID=655863 RepID=F0X7S3_GROCL|nr:Rho guanyl nucleotide exchange factor [Grosmannia clavigera kw1407]EFX06307.1 Rho guanyl nucleotide exchange factor [Grosmannia clavigera kw1407]